MRITRPGSAANRAQFLLALSLLMMTTEARSVEPPAAPKLQDDEMLIGPTSLADWFKDRVGEKTRDDFLADFDLNLNDVVAAFRECRLYLIEKKRKTESGKWVFAKSRDNGFPKVILAGKQSFTVKDRSGKEVTIKIERVKFSRYSTNNTLDLPQCRSGMNFALSARGPFRLAGVQVGEHSATSGFASDLTYDVSGKEIVMENEKK